MQDFHHYLPLPFLFSLPLIALSELQRLVDILYLQDFFKKFSFYFLASFFNLSASRLKRVTKVITICELAREICYFLFKNLSLILLSISCRFSFEAGCKGMHLFAFRKRFLNLFLQKMKDIF